MRSFGEYDDHSLFSIVKKGSKDAFTEVFRRYYSSLCSFTTFIIADKDVAEEIVQDLFVTIWQKRDMIDITTSLKAYLYMAAKNRAVNYIRKNKDVSLSDHIKEIFLTTETPHEILEIKEFNKNVRNAVDRLPEQAKRVFVLRYFNNKKQKDVARIMNISENTVEKHMMNALRQMRKSLGRQIIT